MRLNGLSYPALALAATMFTWGVTALGAGVVFLFGSVRAGLMDGMLGFSGGVMLAAAYFSLLAPAIALANEQGGCAWAAAGAGFAAGGLLFCALDALCGQLMQRRGGTDSRAQSGRRQAMVTLSITLHNIPEGMAVGVAFGSLAFGLEGCTLASAWMLALGIGLQNFPEGAAVSLPLLREGMSRRRAFFYGQLSAVVEPVFGLLGALLVLHMRAVLPFLLSFAAGAMVFVVLEELLPASRSGGQPQLSTLFALAGFWLMMTLDVALG